MIDKFVPDMVAALAGIADGCGVRAFHIPAGADTLLAEGRDTWVINGRTCLVEYPLHGDVALIAASEAGRLSNLTHCESALHYNLVMAMAAKLTIVPTRHFVPLVGMVRQALQERREAESHLT